MSALLDLVGTIAAAGAGAWIAAQVALGQWRAEMVGRRRAELAEQVLADFYRIKTELQEFGMAWGWAETKDQQARALQSLLAFHAEMNSRRYRFAVVFGPAAHRRLRRSRDSAEHVRFGIPARNSKSVSRGTCSDR